MNPWLIVGVLVSWLIVGAGTWRIAATYTSSAWQEREAKINAEAAKQIKEAGDRVLKAEREGATALAKVSEGYQSDLKEVANEKDSVIRDLRARNRRLSIAARCPTPSRDTPSAPAAAATGRDAEARAELSAEAAEFLVALASEADAVVHQLLAAQRIIEEDRRICR